jgi:hypothetical protein
MPLANSARLHIFFRNLEDHKKPHRSAGLSRPVQSLLVSKAIRCHGEAVLVDSQLFHAVVRRSFADVADRARGFRHIVHHRRIGFERLRHRPAP